MRLTRQAALAIALVCGLLAAVLAWMWIGKQNKPAEKVSTTVEVPVPIQTIPAQMQLRPEMFKKIVMEKTRVPQNAVLTEQGFEGRITRVELLQDQPVTADQIAIRSNKLGLAYGLAQGQRAMSIALDLVGAVADFIQPGNRVDVLVSFQREGKVVVRTVVQDVLVLATGTATAPPPPPSAPAATGATKANEAPPPKRPEIPFTLAVTPAQAQLILTADVGGDLRLLLRGMGDHGIVPLPSANSWSMIGPLPSNRPSTGAAPPPAATPPAAATRPPTPQGPQNWGNLPVRPELPTPKRPTVEVIRGGQRELVTPG